jgi:hypothetical protein
MLTQTPLAFSEAGAVVSYHSLILEHPSLDELTLLNSITSLDIHQYSVGALFSQQAFESLVYGLMKLAKHDHGANCTFAISL